jgi:hypothetical protein
MGIGGPMIMLGVGISIGIGMGSCSLGCSIGTSDTRGRLCRFWRPLATCTGVAFSGTNTLTHLYLWIGVAAEEG